MISVEGLRVVDAAARSVLDGVDLLVREGTTHAIVGESGSGKTTLALALLGHSRPGLRVVGGRVSVDGADPGRMPRAELARFRRGTVSWLAQDPALALAPHLSVRRLLAENAPDPRVRDEDLVAVLDLVGLPPLLNRRPSQLSGGQRRRVALARAVMSRPRLLVLDEPTSGLDRVAADEVLGMLATLRRALGTTTVLISHDLEVVGRVADDVSVMRDGRVVESGETHVLLSDPASELSVSRALATLPPAAAEERPAVLTAGAVLSVQSLTVDTPSGHRIVEDLSLELGRGEAVALVGPSGSGKSTLVKTIAGFSAPVAGSIVVDGARAAWPLSQRPPALRRAVQVVNQDPVASLNPALSARRQIARAVRRARPRSSRRDVSSRVDELVSQVGLDGRTVRSRPARLSGGEAQRVAIARALAYEPLVLLCDEVTSALDPSVQRSVLDLLDSLRRHGGLCLVVVTHDDRVARYLCGREMVLGAGR